MVASQPTAEGAPVVPVVRRGRLGSLLHRPVVGGLEILSRRLRREFDLNTRLDEHVRFCLRGERGHALVCLDDRILILKRGFHAGATFGAMSATIFYGDVTGIQVRSHLLSGWIEIQSPSFQGIEHKRSLRSPSSERNAFKQPNCVPIQRRHLAVYQQALVELRRFVLVAKAEQGHTGVVEQLERLATLRREGALDDDEFALAKSRILADLGPGSELLQAG